MEDAQLIIQRPSLLVSAVNRIEDLPITEGDASLRSARPPRSCRSELAHVAKEDRCRCWPIIIGEIA
jgi:hypothetical protein